MQKLRLVSQKNKKDKDVAQIMDSIISSGGADDD